jgi:hypothetical protein
MYSGTWRAEQTGVKAPGRAKRITFLLAHSLLA